MGSPRLSPAAGWGPQQPDPSPQRPLCGVPEPFRGCKEDAGIPRTGEILMGDKNSDGLTSTAPTGVLDKLGIGQRKGGGLTSSDSFFYSQLDLPTKMVFFSESCWEALGKGSQRKEGMCPLYPQFTGFLIHATPSWRSICEASAHGMHFTQRANTFFTIRSERFPERSGRRGSAINRDGIS